MAQGDVFIDGDGKIGIDATGKIRLVDASSDCPTCCGCTASGTSCTHCDDTTPSQYTVTFSGVTICTGCVQDQNTGSYINLSYNGGFNLNGTFTLTQNTSCVWESTRVNALTMEAFSDSGCTTSTQGPTTSDLTIRLSRGATAWDLTVSTDGFGIGPEGEAASGAFADFSVAADTDGGGNQLCATVPSFTNENTGSGSCGSLNSGGDGSVYFYDGIATVACV